MTPSYLGNLRENWEKLAKDDPYWSILKWKGKQRRWQTGEFYATGVREVGELMGTISSLGLAVAARRALDFGCGAGRLTKALAKHFESVDGIDISPTMIELAKLYGNYGDRCNYSVLEGETLPSKEGSFDLVVSLLTLQHINPSWALRFVREMLRVTAAEGVLLFQIPSTPKVPLLGVRARVTKAIREAAGIPVMEMHGIPRRSVERAVEQCGGRVVHVEKDERGGPYWNSCLYVCKRASS